jgi:anti-anti-sigma factor
MFQRETIGNINIITLEVPTLDATNVSQVTGLLEQTMRSGSQIVLDLGALRYFDVSGFAAILRWAVSGQAGQEVRLCSQSGAIRALLELLQADTIFQLYRRREDAVASLKVLRLSPVHARQRTPQSRRSDRRAAQFVN